VKAVQAADVRQKFAEQIDMEIVGSTPAEFATFQKAEQDRWFKVINDNGIKAD
jgi:tripartite-type tricarboxylate transporter receptor subunit TctC